MNDMSEAGNVSPENGKGSSGSLSPSRLASLTSVFSENSWKRTVVCSAISIGAGAILGIVILVVLAGYHRISFQSDQVEQADIILKSDMMTISHYLNTERDRLLLEEQMWAGTVVNLDEYAHGKAFIMVCYDEGFTGYEIIGAVLHSPDVYLLPHQGSVPERVDRARVETLECGFYPFGEQYVNDGATGIGPEVYAEYAFRY